jgi:hypothetical protein
MSSVLVELDDISLYSSLDVDEEEEVEELEEEDDDEEELSLSPKGIQCSNKFMVVIYILPFVPSTTFP